MKIYSWNVNGLRAVYNKGALEKFIQKEDPDIILFQEIKVQEDKIPEELKDASWIRFYNPAEKAGYSGVSIWVHPRNKKIFGKFSKGMPKWNDGEGRIATCELTNGICLISIYTPNGGKSEEHYQEKLKFYKLLASYTNEYKKKGFEVLIGGDFNVARSELDLAEPDKHRNHTHFNEEVRGTVEDMLKKGNLIDTYRSRNPDEEGSYSYWDNFSFSLPKGVRPRDINRGWRLDYMFATLGLDKKIKEAIIHQNILGSDHCPISIKI